MKHFLISALVFINSVVFAQHQLDWVNTPDIDNYTDQYIDDIEVDKAGNIFTLQYTHRHSNNLPYANVFKGLIKQNASGDVVWKRQLGSDYLPEYNYFKLLLQKNDFLYTVVYENAAFNLYKINGGTGDIDTVFSAWVPNINGTNYELQLKWGSNGHLYAYIQVLDGSRYGSVYDVNENDSLVGVTDLRGTTNYNNCSPPFFDYNGNIYYTQDYYVNSQHVFHLVKKDRQGQTLIDSVLPSSGFYILQIDSFGNLYANDGTGIFKMDSNFNQLWRYPTTLEPWRHRLDTAGNLYLILDGAPNILRCVKLNTNGGLVYSKPFTDINYSAMNLDVTATGDAIVSGFAYTGISDVNSISNKQIAWLKVYDPMGNLREVFYDTLYLRTFTFVADAHFYTEPNGTVYIVASFNNRAQIDLGNTPEAEDVKYAVWAALKLCQKCDLNSVSGKIVADTLSNCMADSMEPPAAGSLVHLTPGTRMAIADSRGNYKFGNVAPGNYTTQLSTPSFLNTACDTSYSFSITPDSLQSAHNFLVQPQSGCRMYLRMAATRARSGELLQANIHFFNERFQPVDGWLAVTCDSALEFAYASTPPDSIDGNTCYWNFLGLDAWEQKDFQLFYNVGMVQTTVSYYHLSAGLFTDCNSYVQAVEQHSVSDIIFNSFDPNDKQVWPLQVRQQNAFTNKYEPLEYQINFQNTGNDTAYKIILRDTLDSNLDMSTFKIIGSSHPYNLEAGADRNLIFTFNNINLLPTTQPLMHLTYGYIKYSIVPNSTLTYGQYVNNRASIYFDFNNPIVTNNVNLLYTQYNAINEVANVLAGIYPNPTSDKLFVQSNRPVTAISIYSVTGALLNQVAFSQQGIDISTFTAGIYIAEIKLANTLIRKRFTKM
jgi:uncharacterized repeat protein (TIGR01451 family)